MHTPALLPSHEFFFELVCGGLAEDSYYFQARFWNNQP
jgi:hypothetical protein